MSERLRYEETHWSRENDVAKALKKYLELAGREYNRTKIKLFRKLLPDVNGSSILDYGGGAGIMSVPLAKDGAKVVLVDAELNGLKTAEYYAKKEGVDGDIRTIHSEIFPVELKESCFDIVIAKDILEHIDKDFDFIANLASCQKKGGILLLSTQNSLSLNYFIEGGYQKYVLGNRKWCGWDATHFRFYTYLDLKNMLKRAGYIPLRWAGAYLIPYNILSYFTLGRIKIDMLSLHYLDLTLGHIFPFNRLGWNIIVMAKKI
ncbi:MAG: methyltransferase domain-containing protein [Nitrospirota bacterium]